LPRLAQEEARAQLRALVELYVQGRRVPLPFFVRTSWVHAVECAKAERKAGEAATVSVFEKAARDAESENGFGGPNEFESDAARIVWRGRELPGAADGELARQLHRAALIVFAQPARAWTERFK
jgi:exonuclease V gamma subunit